MVTFAEINVLVIGAGVSGLTTGVCLAEAGIAVRVLAQDPPRRTTSALAGASWGPYAVSDERVLEWCVHSRLQLEKIARREGERCGIRLVPGLEAAPFPMEPPEWAQAVPDFAPCTPDELPAGYVSGWTYTLPLVDMPVYLAYLEARLAAAGTNVEIGTVDTLDEVRDAAPVIVNCTGLGARKLVPDDEMFPIRGQLVVVENPGISRFFQDNAEGEDLTYILPHGDHVVLGGTLAVGTESTVVDPDVTTAIVRRCAAVEPLLADARVIGNRVGLRPSRPAVRVEEDRSNGYRVIHNYGHGGSGVTLSWGCAQEVLRLVGRF